jgi:hypothetical protein
MNPHKETEARKKIVITGLPGVGKIILIKLLDAHPELVAIHTHDKILEGLIQARENPGLIEFSKKMFGDSARFAPHEEIGTKLKYLSRNLSLPLSPFWIRRMLSQCTGYYITEQWAEIGVMPDESSSGHYESEEFKFDFNSYERRWKDSIWGVSREIGPERLYDAFLEAYELAWLGYPKSEVQRRAFALIGPNDPVSTTKFLLKENFDAKIIFVQRSLRGQILTRALRIFRRDKAIGSGASYQSHVRAVLAGDLATRYQKVVTQMEQIRREHPDQVSFLDIDVFLSDHKAGIDQLSDWLGLSESSQIYVPSNAGKRVTESYLSRMNDDESEVTQALNKLIAYQADPAEAVSTYGYGVLYEVAKLRIGNQLRQLANLTRVGRWGKKIIRAIVENRT